MLDQKGAKRTYNSARRQAQARETRRQIVEAARHLFIERGYVGSTIEAIAQQAGVAVETVYVAFGSKRAILSSLIDVSIGGDGDDEPVPVLERPGPQEARKERDQRRQLRLFAHGIREIMGRVGPVFIIMRSAAHTELEIATLLDTLLKERLGNLTQFVQWVASNGPLREGLSVPDAADTVWTLSSAEVHHLLTVDLGWSGERYEEWLGDTLIAVLLP
jgi:AcrR family transcriptional regulator